MKHLLNITHYHRIVGLAAVIGFSSFYQSSSAQTAPEIAEQEPTPWESSASAGLTLTRGNSDTIMVTSNLSSRRNWDRNEARLGASAAYGETDNERSTERFSAFGQYNRLFSDRMFGYARLDGLRDGVADIEYRVAFSPGLGYYFIKTGDTSLSVEVGPGVIYEKQGGTYDTYATLRIAQRFEHRLTDRSRIWQFLEFLPQVDDFDNYIINSEIGVESQLTEKLSLRSYLQNSYDNEPAAGRKKHDMKLVTALAYTF